MTKELFIRNIKIKDEMSVC